MAKTKNQKPEATEATEAATKNEDQAVTGQPTPTPAVETLAVETLVVWDPIEGHATLAQLAKEGFPVVVIREPEGAYRAMVPAFGPIQTGAVGLTIDSAPHALEEAMPQALEDFKKQTGQERPEVPAAGCVHGNQTLEEYLATPPGEWSPFWGDKAASTDEGTTEEAEAQRPPLEAMLDRWYQHGGDVPVLNGETLGSTCKKAGVGNFSHLMTAEAINQASMYSLEVWPDGKSWMATVAPAEDAGPETLVAFADDPSEAVLAWLEQHAEAVMADEVPKVTGTPVTISTYQTGQELTDESAIRVLLAARGDKTNRAHQERRPGWLARARRKRDGKDEYIHLELIENPDAPMVDQAANARVASERGALNGQVTSWKRECKDLMDDIVNRLRTVSGDEEVRAELFAALEAGEEWEGMQPKDASVRDRCLEHLKRIDTLEDQIAEAESRLAEIEATLSDQRQHAQVVLDLKFTTTGNLVLHVSE
ncbi:MAG TPA: hypothetical protein PLB31_05335 [Fimbriimonadaceae bacterium]|nr:hypothetical protein [Armatimonadota bacterium]HRI73877.1 hypothetical protein [Fimbriimonadaceae bacterium]